MWLHHMVVNQRPGQHQKLARNRRLGGNTGFGLGLDYGASRRGNIASKDTSKDSRSPDAARSWNLDDYAKRMEDRGLGKHGVYSHGDYYTRAYDEANGFLMQPMPPPRPPEPGAFQYTL